MQETATEVHEVVTDAVARLGGGPARPLRVVDVGGGTGGQAVALAEQGHAVVVVDPSADALATLGRRARSAGVEVETVQARATEMVGVVGPDADLVLCHGLLEVVDDVEQTLASLHQVLRPQGLLSVVVAGRPAAVLARLRAGDVEGATAVLAGDGRSGPRRFDAAELTGLVRGAGFRLEQLDGLRIAAALLPADPDGAVGRRTVTAFERAAAADETLRVLGSSLHALASRPDAAQSQAP
ncbi:class I SAM-dependent methyltransferase [Mumia flava]|uniref:class I SAM-dependent methyltransferase n=1 Tax=Mumia flava TaxID=1348852 RepID=UPI0012FD6633|nr:class I SAM-dependent methyltransferase [Mumia flava]